MLKRLNHIAIVVPDVKKAKEIYKQKFNAVVSDPKSYPEQGVTVVFVELENTKIELMEPYGKNSPIIKFLEKNPDGGMHHICLEVSDINKSLENLKNKIELVLKNENSTKKNMAYGDFLLSRYEFKRKNYEKSSIHLDFVRTIINRQVSKRQCRKINIWSASRGSRALGL